MCHEIKYCGCADENVQNSDEEWRCAKQRLNKIYLENTDKSEIKPGDYEKIVLYEMKPSSILHYFEYIYRID